MTLEVSLLDSWWTFHTQMVGLHIVLTKMNKNEDITLFT